MFIGVERPEDVGESILILPIDIFFKNPHLRPPLSFPSLDLRVLCLSVELCSACDCRFSRAKLRPEVFAENVRLDSGEVGSSPLCEILSHNDCVKAGLELLAPLDDTFKLARRCGITRSESTWTLSKFELEADEPY
jgi:hypothetical protein